MEGRTTMGAGHRKSATTNEDTAVDIDVIANDTDSLRVSAVGTPPHGTVVIKQGSTTTVTYTPDANYSGADSFTYTVSDRASVGLTATSSVPVTNVNGAPDFLAATATRSVAATDAATPALTDTVAGTINITNVNEAPVAETAGSALTVRPGTLRLPVVRVGKVAHWRKGTPPPLRPNRPSFDKLRSNGWALQTLPGRPL